MRAAQRRGRKLGRSAALKPGQALAIQRIAICDDMPLEVIAARMKVSKTTVWRAVAKIKSAARLPRSEI